MSIEKLKKLISSDNVAEFLSDSELENISSLVVEGYDIDLNSRSDVDKINKEAMKIAKQTIEKKNFPWPGAANVKYPLITVAAIQFASRALPELIPDEKIVNIKIIGEDLDGEKEKAGERVAKYMDFQITEQMTEWIDGTDRLLHSLPITGTCFRKIYYDPVKKRCASKFLMFDDVVVNIKAENLRCAERISHRIYKSDNYIAEMKAEGLWRDVDFGTAHNEDNDPDAPHLFIEQHRWLDLDKDGYKEPYIVTVHKESRQVARIVARYTADSIKFKAGRLVSIEPDQYFVKYPFIPNPDGGFYDIGFGSLLYPINDSINTVINQLLDAGTMANTGGGFLSRGVTLSSGPITFKPGEWKKTDIMSGDLRAGVLPLPVREPSQVLFALLGLLVTAGKDISSVQEAVSGQKPGENVSAATVAALIEQGLKVFSGIYKRNYRSLSEELKLLFKLNGKYLNDREYSVVLDEEIRRTDFSSESFNIIPSAEPMFSLDMQRVAKAEATLRLSGRPGMNEDEITRMYLKAIKVPEKVMLPMESRPAPPPDPELERVAIEKNKFILSARESSLKIMKLFAEIEDLRASAMLKVAKAEGETEGIQLEQYKAFVNELGMRIKAEKEEYDRQERLFGMEKSPGNDPTAQTDGGAQGGVF